MDYRDKLICDLAERECNRICRSTIRYLQKLKGDKVMLSGPDSGLKNTWDEICVQVQGSESPFWQVYLDTITPYIAYAVEHLKRPEQEAIWIQTPEAFDWDADQEDAPTSVPICLDDITLYILDQYVLRTATDYRNSRVEKFLQQPFDGAFDAGQGPD